MRCPLCNVEMRITNSKNVVENDDTPDKETKLYLIQEVSCLNKACANYQRVVESSKTEIQIN